MFLIIKVDNNTGGFVDILFLPRKMSKYKNKQKKRPVLFYLVHVINRWWRISLREQSARIYANSIRSAE